MSDARTKLRAFAPEFLEVIEVLDARISHAHELITDNLVKVFDRLAGLEKQYIDLQARFQERSANQTVAFAGALARLESIKHRLGTLEDSVSNISMSMPERDRRFDLLEGKLLVRSDNDREEMRLMRERIEALEATDATFAITQADRWHKTRDAALADVAGFTSWTAAEILEHCAKIADLAHGPLEVKALSDDEMRKQQIAAFSRMQPGPERVSPGPEWRSGFNSTRTLNIPEQYGCPHVGCEKLNPHVHTVAGPHEDKT